MQRNSFEEAADNEFEGHTQEALDGRALSSKQERELVKLFRDLRNDIGYLDKNSTLPDTWTIRCLISSCNCSGYDGKTWLMDTLSLLQNMKAQALLEKEGLIQFYQLDNSQRLFSEDMGFKLHHLFGFIEKLENHLFSLDDNYR